MRASTQLPQVPVDQKFLQKERILVCLTKLNDRDTHKSAADELSSIVREIDVESIQLLFSCLCGTGSHQKPLARKETLRVFGNVVAESCPARHVALQPPLFPKLLSHLKKCLQDGDNGVREAASEVAGAVAQALTEVTGAPLEGSHSSPLIKVIFECLAEQRKETQTAAGCALHQVSSYIGSLEKDLIKDMLKMLKSPTFFAAAPLLMAMGHILPGTRCPSGLIKSCTSSLLPYIVHLVGQTSNLPASTGSGLLGCLGSKDWAVRKAAADCLRALALQWGPALEPDPTCNPLEERSIIRKCSKGLHTVSFDKVREARDIARDARAVLDELQTHLREGGSVQEWKEKLATGDEPISPSWSHPSPLAVPDQGPRKENSRISPVGRQSSMHERFQSAHSKDDTALVASPPKSQIPNWTDPHTPREVPSKSSVEGVEMESHDQTSIPEISNVAQTRARPSRDSTSGSGRPSSSSVPPVMGQNWMCEGLHPQDSGSQGQVMMVSVAEWEAMRQQLHELKQQQDMMRQQQLVMCQMYQELAQSCRGDINDLQERLCKAEQAVAHSQQEVCTPLVVTLEPDSSAREGMHAEDTEDTSGQPEGQYWDNAQLVLTNTAIPGTSTGDSYPSCSPDHTSNPCTPRLTNGVCGEGSTTPRTGGDLDAAYVAALQEDRSSMHLMRLMSKTGPVWNQLSPTTSQSLLNTFIQHLADGAVLHRVLPWLWQLAEDHNCEIDISKSDQLGLLASLKALPCTEDSITERVQMLISTLRTVWGLVEEPLHQSSLSEA